VLQVPPQPTIESVSQSNARWREGNKLAAYSRNNKPPVGTIFSFVLNQRATVMFAFTQHTDGRRAGGKCVAQTKANRRKHGCRRTVKRGTLSLVGRSGLNKVVFEGRISNSRRLPLGVYTVRITALDPAGESSTPRVLSFTVVN
jgi:hypothetical protein